MSKLQMHHPVVQYYNAIRNSFPKVTFSFAYGSAVFKQLGKPLVSTHFYARDNASVHMYILRNRDTNVCKHKITRVCVCLSVCLCAMCVSVCCVRVCVLYVRLCVCTHTYMHVVCCSQPPTRSMGSSMLLTYILLVHNVSIINELW